MTEIYPDQRAITLADARNLYHTAQSLYSRNIDYSSFLQKGTVGRALTCTITYVIRADPPGEVGFFNIPVDIGFETKIRDIETLGDGSKKADWNLGIALDTASFVNHVDTVILCSSGGDFERLCMCLHHEDVHVRVMVLKESTTEELVAATNTLIDLSEREETFLL